MNVGNERTFTRLHPMKSMFIFLVISINFYYFHLNIA
jgi:hypothetical protein